MSARVFDFDHALVRLPAPSVVDGLRTGREQPAYDRVVAEHRAYVTALETAGLAVETLPPLDAYPDSIFVEDPAFVLPEGAILLKPGTCSRMGETAEIAPALEGRFPLMLTLDEGFADGGDILILPDEILIGLSGRTDMLGAKRFVELAATLGRRARIVSPPPGALHLKTACALIDEDWVIATPAFASLFEGREVLTTPEGEEAAANLVRVNDTVLMPSSCPRAADMVAARGLEVVTLETTEIAKIDAGLSCMSLRWRAG